MRSLRLLSESYYHRHGALTRLKEVPLLRLKYQASTKQLPLVHRGPISSASGLVPYCMLRVGSSCSHSLNMHGAPCIIGISLHVHGNYPSYTKLPPHTHKPLAHPSCTLNPRAPPACLETGCIYQCVVLSCHPCSAFICCCWQLATKLLFLERRCGTKAAEGSLTDSYKPSVLKWEYWLDIR